MHTLKLLRRAAALFAAAALAPAALAQTTTCPQLAGTCTPPVLEPTAPARVAPRVSTAPMHPGRADPARGSVTAAYATPAYTSLDEPRALALEYASGTADPTALVQVDAELDPNAETPTALSIQVRDPRTGAMAALAGGGTELFSLPSAEAAVRLAAQLDVSGLATGAYAYDAVVRAYYADGSWMEAPPARVRVLVVNERGSRYGAGWIVSGVQRLYPQGDGVMLVEGDGSARWFAWPGACVKGYQTTSTWCAYTSPDGDFSRLARDTVRGVYTRHYVDRTLVEFSATGQMTSVRAEGLTTRFDYSFSRLASVTDPAGLALRLEYDAAGKLSAITDPAGRRFTARVGAAGVLDSICDPLGCALRAGYDARKRMTWRSDRAGARWDFEYDAHGRLARVTAPSVAVDGRGTVRPATTFRSLEAAVLPAAGTGSSASPAPPLAAPAVRVAVTDATGATVQARLDRYGEPLRVEEPLGRVTTVARDAHGRPTRTVAFNGDVTEYTYDGAHPLSVRDVANDRTTTFTWSSYRGAPYVSYPYADAYRDYPLTVRAPGGETTEYRRVGDRLVATKDGASRVYFDATHDTDGFGRPLTAYGAGGHTRYFYAAAGKRNLDSMQVVRGADTLTTRMTRDTAGRVVRTVSPDGAVHTAAYDALNRVLTVGGPAGATTYAYAPAGWLRQVTDPRGQAYVYGRNALGWLEWEQDPRGGTLRMTYDEAGRLKSGTNRRGQAVRYDHDALGRTTKQTSHEGAVTTYAHDPAGRWTAVTNAESSDTIRVVRGSLSSVSQVSVRGSARYVLNTRRDTAAHATHVTTTWGYGLTLTSADEEARRPLELLDHRTGLRTAIVRDDSLNTVSIVLPTGDTLVYGHEGVRYSDPSAGSVGTELARAPTGRVEALDSLVLAYDAVGQLLRESRLGGDGWETARSYGWDAVGNPTHGAASVSTGNRLDAFGGYALSYDADGNLVRKVRTGSLDQTLAWNSLGQLVRVTSAGVDVTFGYDGMGRRVRKTSNGVVTRYLYDGHHLVAETDAAGTVTREYTYYPGVDRPHSLRSGGRTYYYLADAQGNVEGVADAAGTVVNRYAYTPFGAAVSVQEGVANPLRFAARPYDAETGLYHFRARFYDPALQRFASEDPLGLGGGINPYAYAGNSPVNATDPTGMAACASWEVMHDGVCVQAWVIPIPGITTFEPNPLPSGRVPYDPMASEGDDLRRQADPAAESDYWDALAREGEAERWAVQRQDAIDEAIRSAREAADLGVGFVPGVSTIHDGTVVFTGYNPITGDREGWGGRFIAFAGMVTPVSGGQLRGVTLVAENILARGLRYSPRVENVTDAFHSFPKWIDEHILLNGRYAQRRKDRAHWFELDGAINGVEGVFQLGIDVVRNEVFHRNFVPF